MPASISCICGYVGPPVADRNLSVCPICRTPSGPPTTVIPPPIPAPPPAFDSRAMPAVPGIEPADDHGTPPSAYRIPCPRGHVLKAGEHMLGQQVVCPTCNEFFVLKITDSLEYRKEMRRLQDEKEARDAARWLRRAILAAVFVVASFAVMLAIKIMMK